jgi:hypothetical protein
MQQTVAISEIKKRAEAVNVTLKRLARRAKVHPSTAYRASISGDCRVTTNAKLSRELVAEELRLLDHLLALHGIPERSAA